MVFNAQSFVIQFYFKVWSTLMLQKVSDYKYPFPQDPRSCFSFYFPPPQHSKTFLKKNPQPIDPRIVKKTLTTNWKASNGVH